MFRFYCYVKYPFFALFLNLFILMPSSVQANFISKFFKQTLPNLLAPRMDLWKKWSETNALDIKTISHKKWGNFLKKYMFENHNSGIGRFNYSSVEKKDFETLKNYVNDLASLKITHYNRKEQKAYWINLYNALTVKLILEHYPLKSIRDIKIKQNHASFGPWDAKLIKIEGAALSLNDIEHRILRPITKDPLVHYALNCASLGCPMLRKKQFTSKNMKELLEDSAIKFINHKRAVENKKGELHVSSIYIWFKSDFGKSDGDLMNHLIKYSKGSLKIFLNNYNSGIFGHSYNWRLNDSKK